ncbi:adenylate/guanylate cyclase [Candidatus Bipolaricaulota bacterium]|nr:adenylate/guanylate cyclase [Candidatus Bipolaricaulota bacterium]
MPGHSVISQDDVRLDQFIALVADMRKSTEHLMCAISQKTATASQLERVFYETAALLPGLAVAIGYEDGSVTEYLGDGVLALFPYDKSDPDDSIRTAYRGARNCLQFVDDVLNPELDRRYSLPGLEIGVGLACSRALVTLVGTKQFAQPKAFGECVFRATKLSKGHNEIRVDARLYNEWPQSKGGQLRFIEKQYQGWKGYVVKRKH